MSDLISEFVKARASIHRLDGLGGTESFFGKEHIFEELLREEHEKDGLTDTGMYCFKGFNQYGNIVSWQPTLRTIAAFLAHGYTRQDLERLRDWWKDGINSMPDTICLGSMVKSALDRDDIKALLVESDKVQAELAEAEAARVAAIPHLSPPEDALPFKHHECISDFAGNHSQPGAWADVHMNECGQTVITFGGNWEYYCKDGILDKFMGGERGCPVEARPAKVKALFKKVEDTDNEFSVIIDFLNKNHAELRFSEEFKWGNAA